MPPRRFARPGLSGNVTVRRFKAPQLETTARIKKGELTEPLEVVAGRVGLRAAPPCDLLTTDLCLVDDQELTLMGGLVDKGVYFISGGVSKCSHTTSAAPEKSEVPPPSEVPCADTAEPMDVPVGWCFDTRMLLHRPFDNRSPETPHRLQRAIEALRLSERACDFLPSELLIPINANIDGSVGITNEQTVPTRSAANRSKWIPARLATINEVSAFHDANVYGEFVEKGSILRDLKSDVYCNAGTSSIAARLSLGAVIDASVEVLQAVAAHRSQENGASIACSSPLIAFCLVRPPGHHCTASQPSGFCLVNNVAVAVQHLRGNCPSVLPSGVPRIAILDLDVHFGEGTASYVEDVADPDSLLYLSLHRYDAGGFYPFDPRGDTAYVGGGSGGYHCHSPAKGCLCNVAVNTHAQSPSACEQVISDYLWNSVTEDIFFPRLVQFRPDLVMVSLGFDAALGDPLGKMAVEGGFASVMSRLKEWCRSEGRTTGLVVVLEGGYNPEAVAKGVLAVGLALSFPRNCSLVQRCARECPPQTWVGLRKRQERRYRQWVQIQKERAEERGAAAPSPAEDSPPSVTDEPESVPDDGLLLERHQQWCAAFIKKVQQLHRDAASE